MTHSLWVSLGVVALAACTPEPVHEANDVSGPPAPQGTGQPATSAPEQAPTESAAPGVEAGAASPRNAPTPTTTTTTTSNGATQPSSTQGKEAATPAPNVPNAMPQPDAL
jgi:hypothetical protein